ncbi:MAG: hypothetical protein AAFU85_23865 [Planctomycetota bacterium]
MASDQQILDEARASLLRILQTDTSSWSNAERSQQQIQVRELNELIDSYERKVANAGRRSFIQPVRRVDL